MEYIFEAILDLLLEGGIEVSKNRKISKWIRYPIIAIITLFFLSVIGLIFLAGILIFKTNKFASIFLILIGVFMLIMSIIKFRKLYLIKKEKMYE